MPYNSVVIVREIWDTRDLIGQILDDNGKIKEGTLSTRFEPEDLNALEMAMQIKDKHGGKVTAISIGPSRNVDVLRECLYRGVDEVTRIDEPNFRELDTNAAAVLFSQALKKIASYDLVFVGVSVVEGENSLLGAQVAKLLGLEHISYVDTLHEIGNGRISCKRAVEMGYEIVETKLPAVIVAGVALVKDDPRTPRSAKAMLKLQHKKTPIPSWKSQELDVPDSSSIKTTITSKYEAVEPRKIVSKQIDPQDESALKQMLNEVL